MPYVKILSVVGTKEVVSDHVRQLQPAAAMGEYEHFQKFRRLLDQLECAGMLDPTVATEFMEKCTRIWKTPLKVCHNCPKGTSMHIPQ